MCAASGCRPGGVFGFAFGLGIDRMVGLMYGLMIFASFENDVRFLEQFD